MGFGRKCGCGGYHAGPVGGAGYNPGPVAGAGYGYGGPVGGAGYGSGGGFALIVVLFILLIIVGAVWC